MTLIFCTHQFSLLQKDVERVVALRNQEIFFDLPPSEVDDALLERLYAEDGIEQNSSSVLVTSQKNDFSEDAFSDSTVKMLQP